MLNTSPEDRRNRPTCSTPVRGTTPRGLSVHTPPGAQGIAVNLRPGGRRPPAGFRRGTGMVEVAVGPAAGQKPPGHWSGILRYPCSTAHFYTRTDIVAVPVDDLSPNRVALVWVAERQNPLLREFAEASASLAPLGRIGNKSVLQCAVPELVDRPDRAKQMTMPRIVEEAHQPQRQAELCPQVDHRDQRPRGCRHDQP